MYVPDWSDTAPRMRPVFPCGKAGREREARRNQSQKANGLPKRTQFDILTPINPLLGEQTPTQFRYSRCTIITKRLSTISFWLQQNIHAVGVGRRLVSGQVA